MHRLTVWGTAIATIVVLALPFVGGGGPGLEASAHANVIPQDALAFTPTGKACPSYIPGSPQDSVGDTTSPLGVGGTLQQDLVDFALAYNKIRIEHCLSPIPWSNFTWDPCMEDRLFWMAEDPSTDPASAWGHMGSERSDGLPSVGCDGNLAGGSGNTAAQVAQKWWDSLKHRKSLYRPGTSIAGACIAFAMSHGGIPNEAYDFTRAAARWYAC